MPKMKSTLICTFETAMQTAIKEKKYSTVASNEKNSHEISWFGIKIKS